MIRIRDIKAGDGVRIALKAGHQLEPDPHGRMDPPTKPRRARGYSTTTFYGFVLANDPAAGTMTLNLQRGPNQEYAYAVVPYKGMLHLQFVMQHGRPVVETAPKSHPGAQALGTRMAQLFQQPFLVPVSFCGR